MERVFITRELSRSLTVGVIALLSTITMIAITLNAGKTDGVFVVLAIVNIMFLLLALVLLRKRKCIFYDDRFVVKHILFSTKVPYDTISMIRDSTKTKRGKNGEALISVAYVTKFHGPLPIIMYIEEKDEAMEILWSKREIEECR